MSLLPFQISLDEKIALVTGAAKGIGRAISLKLADAGAKLVINDLKASDCEETVREIKSRGADATSVEADISNGVQVEHMVEETVRAFGSLDILVNNAGAVVRKPSLEMSEEEWDRVVDVNLKGTFLCSRAAARQMMKRKKGRIINIASVLGEVALPPRSAYSASKGGIISLTRDMALEFAKDGIRVNAVAPGWVKTETRQEYFAEEGVSKYLLDRIPLGRFCEPGEVASLVAFLASDQADYITGETIAIDGGWMAI